MRKAVAAGVGAHVEGYGGRKSECTVAPPLFISGRVKSIEYGD